MIPSQRGAVRRALSSYSAPTRLRRRRKDADVLSPPPTLPSLAPRRAFFLGSVAVRDAPSRSRSRPAASLGPPPTRANALPRSLPITNGAAAATTPVRCCPSFERSVALRRLPSSARLLSLAPRESGESWKKRDRERKREGERKISGGKGKNEIVKETRTRRAGEHRRGCCAQEGWERVRERGGIL